MSLTELKSMEPKQREDWFMENARYLPRMIRPYFIRIGTSRALIAADTMELRQKFDALFA